MTSFHAEFELDLLRSKGSAVRGSRYARTRERGATLLDTVIGAAFCFILLSFGAVTLSASIGKAASATCASNQRVAQVLASSYATDHADTLPVAGLFQGFGDFGENARFEDLPAELRFSQQFWTWGEGDGGRRMLPYSLALAKGAGFAFDDASRAGVLEAAGLTEQSSRGRPSIMDIFRCPSDSTWALGDLGSAGSTLAYSGEAAWQAPPHIPVMSSYVLNEQLLGSDGTGQFQGRLDRNRYPSEQVLIVDGDGRNAWGDNFQVMFVADEIRDGSGNRDITGNPDVYTVQEYYTLVENHPNGSRDRPNQFELSRHDGTLNAGYMDGSVVSVPNTAAGRDELVLLRTER
ncbi:MAG: hypothetical protein AAGG07_05900 [Planctomycetota bacterium]